MSTPDLTQPVQQKTSHLVRDSVGTLTGKLTGLFDQQLKATLEHGLRVFGFLIKRNEKLTIQQFVDRIKSAYDCDDCPQNAAVVEALRRLM